MQLQAESLFVQKETKDLLCTQTLDRTEEMMLFFLRFFANRGLVVKSRNVAFTARSKS